MPEIGKMGGGAIPPGGAGGAGQAQAPSEVPIGQPGALGQPTGMPIPGVPAGAQVLSDVLAGRDPSQLIAAERMRAAGGASAVEQQLGLDLKPPMMGALSAPPGNIEALRHMTPTMRRTIMRNLLDKQRSRMRELARVVRHQKGERDDETEEQSRDEAQGSFASELFEATVAAGGKADEAQATRARDELGRTARMLDLLDELLVMQDYTVSQMGTFSQG